MAWPYQVRYREGKMFDESQIMADLAPRLRSIFGVADGMSIAQVWACRYSK